MTNIKFADVQIQLLQNLGYEVHLNQEPSYPDYAFKSDLDTGLDKIISLTKDKGVLAKVDWTIDCPILDSTKEKFESYCPTLMDAHNFLETVTRKH